MQDDLFGGAPPTPPPSAAKTADKPASAIADLQDAPAPRKRTAVAVAPALFDDALLALGAALPPLAHLGTSSWTYPGWQGLVWEGGPSESQLSRQGLAVYAQHPLFRTVSIDRGFYRPLTVIEYERYASQVPDNFRFVVKAPSLVTDALVRSEDGRGRQPNTAFLDPQLARTEFVEPALQGLGHKIGALVFQLSPLPLAQLDRMHEVLARLHALLAAQPRVSERAPGGLLAVEVRDPEWLTPEFAAVLRDTGATYCLGLHAKMPPLAEQLPVVRALWPRPLVCRWNLNPVHGPYGYETAEQAYAPYDRMVHPDVATRDALARVIAGATSAGQPAYVAISNHAEGCAPLSVRALAEAVVRIQGERSPPGAG